MILCASDLKAQQTIFNVPSADVLDKGKLYLELDLQIIECQPSASFTPRPVYGAGHDIEIGVNLSSFTTPGPGTIAVVPTLKWKIMDEKKTGVTFLVGDHLYLPVHNRTYDIGNYVYAEAAKSFPTHTRIGVGVYDFSASVVASGNRAGVQASIEQTITKRLNVDADWYSGNSSVGYFTPGIVYKVSNPITFYAGYEIGNYGVSSGNYALLLELGWNIN